MIPYALQSALQNAQKKYIVFRPLSTEKFSSFSIWQMYKEYYLCNTFLFRGHPSICAVM